MRSLVQVLVAIAITIIAGASGSEHAAASQDVTVTQAWSRATPKGSPVAAGYLTIENSGAIPDRLTEVRAGIAKKVDVHTTTIVNGVSSMQAVLGGLVIPANGSIRLEPGSSHLMFVGLNAPLVEGDRIPVELHFERAGVMTANLIVAPLGSLKPRSAGQPPTLEQAAVPVPKDDVFFTHLCGEKLMANLTVSPARPGNFEVLVELEDAQEQPLSAQSVAVTLLDENRQTRLSTVNAERVTAEKWRVQMSAPTRGTWMLSLNVQTSSDDRVEIAAPILIE